MSQMQLQRERSDQQKRECGEQGEAVSGLDGVDAEDALQRGEDEGAGDQSRDEGVENDEDAPLELDFVRVHEAFDGNLHGTPFLQRLPFLPFEPSPDECVRRYILTN